MIVRFQGQSGNPKKPKKASVEIEPWVEGETEIFESFPKDGSRGVKVTTTIRFDPDVREFFESQGPGWQPRINAVLRAYMTQQKLKIKKDDPA